jgi:exodeoxyribonuclease-1
LAYVFYDVETSGLIPGYDQILHFAAIRTDFDLDEMERVEFRSRLMQHVLPSPAALHVNRLSIGEITDQALPSHYEMVCAIRSQLRSWCPSIFAGYNSIRFDEEFLRHSLYQCLHHPYLTSATGNGRLDVLSLVRATAILSPGCLVVPAEDGRPVFRLATLAAANGFAKGRSHEALPDVEATLFLARLVKERAPEIWSQATRFGAKRAVLDFIADEEPMLLVEATAAAGPPRAIAVLGPSSRNPNLRHCLDLAHDPRQLAGLDEEALARLVAGPEGPIVSLRVNAAPMLFTMDDLPPGIKEATDPDTALERAEALDVDGLRERLLAEAEACQREFAPSPDVERQLYEGFWCSEDAAILEQLHDVPWEGRADLLLQLRDRRLRLLGRRLVFLERPDLLPRERLEKARAAVRERLAGSGRAWTTISSALLELNELTAGADREGQARLEEYRVHLERCLP